MLSRPATLPLPAREAGEPAPLAPDRDDDEAARAHRVRLGHLAEALARHLGLDADTAQLLRLAVPLHDAGEPAWPPPAAEIARHHRERWDGSGYPNGLRGSAIPLPARIVAVVDYFDTLTRRRRYRPARADDCGLAMLAEQAGRAFDPAIVAAFLAHAPEMIALRDRLDAAHPPGMHE